MDWTLIIWLVIALQIVLVLVIAACAAGIIGVNKIAGMRTPAVMKSADAWQRGHRAALIPMIPAVGISILLVTLSGVGLVTISNVVVVAIELGLLLLGTAAGGMAAALAARMVP